MTSTDEHEPAIFPHSAKKEPTHNMAYSNRAIVLGGVSVSSVRRQMKAAKMGGFRDMTIPLAVHHLPPSGNSYLELPVSLDFPPVVEDSKRERDF